MIMTNFERLAQASSQSIIIGLGEPFEVLDSLENQVAPLPVRGVFDESLDQGLDAGIPVYIESPNVLMRDLDTQGRLDKRRHQIKRVGTNETFKIVDILRDETATARYMLEKIDG